MIEPEKRAPSAATPAAVFSWKEKVRCPWCIALVLALGTFATTEEQKQVLDVVNSGDEVGRPFVMSAQVPADRLAILRKAFNETMTDPGFLAEMDKQRGKSPMPSYKGKLSEDELTDVVAYLASLKEDK